MKIVHICISDPYIDGWGYQANLLPKYLQQLGAENIVVASENTFSSYLKPEIVAAIKVKGTHYVGDNDTEIYRITTGKVSESFIYTKGLMRILEYIKPDAIFHHNFNCTSLPISARYARKYDIPMVVDNHADTINMTKSTLWAWFYYKFLIRMSCRLYHEQIYKAYGVTHSRCDFIRNYYGVSSDKIDFLPIGADVDLADRIPANDELRKKYGFSADDFIIVSGGKMGIDKRTDNLIAAVEELYADFHHLKLVLFGSFDDVEVKEQAVHSPVTMVYGWCDRLKTLELLKVADVACWPYHHTTLIEDAISVCTPIINRRTSTSEHLISGNGIWIDNADKESIKDALLRLLKQDECHREKMKQACYQMRQTISYHTIARKVLDDIAAFNQ